MTLCQICHNYLQTTTVSLDLPSPPFPSPPFPSLPPLPLPCSSGGNKANNNNTNVRTVNMAIDDAEPADFDADFDFCKYFEEEFEKTDRSNQI